MPHAYSVPLPDARDAFLAELEAFLTTVSSLDDLALLGHSRVHGWSRIDCLVHVRAGLQELLAGIPARTDTAPQVDAASYWSTWEAAAPSDPVPGILTTRRTAGAYNRPTDAVEHLRETVSGLTNLVPLMPDTPVHFQGHSIGAGDLLATWAVEVVVHHHDLGAPDGCGALDPGAVEIGRHTAEALRGDLSGAGDDLSGGDDLHVMLAGFGRA